MVGEAEGGVGGAGKRRGMWSMRRGLQTVAGLDIRESLIQDFYIAPSAFLFPDFI